MVSFDELRDASMQRAHESFGHFMKWGPTDWGNAMAGEAGECCNFVKKLRRLQTDPTEIPDTPEATELIDNIGKEAADVVIYLDLLTARLGISLGEYVVSKFNEVSDRRNSSARL